MNKIYCYGWDEETFYGKFDTELEAIEEARGERPEAEEVYIGTCTEPTLRWSAGEEYIIDSILNNLSEDVGEAAENFEIELGDEKELERMINETVETWIEQNEIKPSCYAVLDAHVVELKKV